MTDLKEIPHELIEAMLEEVKNTVFQFLPAIDEDFRVTMMITDSHSNPLVQCSYIPLEHELMLWSFWIGQASDGQLEVKEVKQIIVPTVH